MSILISTRFPFFSEKGGPVVLIGWRMSKLLDRGVMALKSKPFGMFAIRKTYRNPLTNTIVILQPIGGIASKKFFDENYYSWWNSPEVDKVLCEDGKLPFLAGTVEAQKIAVRRRLFPAYGFRPVVPDASKFDGIVDRDPLESRISYLSVQRGDPLPVDPRARRAVERLDTYPSGTRVVLPWNAHHMVYLNEKLSRLGYVLEKTEEVQAIGQSSFLYAMAVVTALMTIFFMWFSRLISGY